MTREELKAHCEKQIERCEMWANYNGKEPDGRVYEEHKLILELLKQERSSFNIEKKDILKPCEDTISRHAVRDTIFAECSGTKLDIDFAKVLLLQRAIKALPPVTPQPEIVRCSQCKYAEVADSEDSQDGYTCQFHRGSIWFSGSYCSWAERRQDG